MFLLRVELKHEKLRESGLTKWRGVGTRRQQRPFRILVFIFLGHFPPAPGQFGSHGGRRKTW